MAGMYESFREKTLELWNLAHKIKKPRMKDFTWTTGFMQAKGDFLGLQTQVMGLAASIIVCEPEVPEIVIAWDSPQSYWGPKASLRGTGYPSVLLSAVKDKPFETKHNFNLFSSYVAKSQYVTVLRAHQSINNWPNGLGRGYRAKWMGLKYVTTPFGILSDADMLMRRPIMNYVRGLTDKDRNAFCWSSWLGEDKINVGFLVFRMALLNAVFFPHFARIYWETDHKDSTFIPSVLAAYPKLKKKLKLALSDKTLVNAERHAIARCTGKVWNDETTGLWHCWKRDLAHADGMREYESELDDLIKKAKAQI